MSGVRIFTRPHHYSRTGLWTPGKRSVTIPAWTTANIGDGLYQTIEDQVINIDEAAAWDDGANATASNRAGKDFYIYACQPASGTVPEIVLSGNSTVGNSTVPAGKDENNSRKIGGFHCECMDVGTIEGNDLSGWLAGEILPCSAWDLIHRAKSENEGMVYSKADDVWISIYLLSELDGAPASVYGGVILDGSSTPPYHGLKFTEELAKLGMRNPYLHEFFNAFEDCAGVLWQWSNNYGMAGGSGWGSSNFDSTIDGGSGYGRAYGTLWLPCAGGHWSRGGSCGSRAVAGDRSAAYRDAIYAGRAAAEPRAVNL